MKRLLALLLLFVLFLATPSHASTKNGIDLANVLSKLPAVVPFLKTKVKPECGVKLEKFAAEFDPEVTKKAGKTKTTAEDPTLKTALCRVGFDCTKQIVDILAGFVKGGGFMATMAQSMLGDKVDVENLDVMVLAYYQNMCDTVRQAEEL